MTAPRAAPTTDALPCVCGSGTRRVYSSEDMAECAQHLRWMERGYQVQCGINFCDARAPTCDTREEAIESWNRMQAALRETT